MDANSLNLNVLTGSPTPVYRQISDQICTAILEGSLNHGDRLPSFEKVAEALVVSPSSVRRAFRDLIDRGCCSGEPGIDIRVAEVDPGPSPDRVAGTLDDDLIAARDIQLRLMSPSLSEGPGFQAAARQGAAGIVGGDFHHISPDDRRVDVIVGDVAGTGVTAGIVAAFVESSAALLGRHLSLACAMSALNEHLSPLLGSRRFVAMAWARLDLHAHVLEIANAGLPDPYLFEPGSAPRAISVPGTRLPLGSRKGLGYETVTLPFEPGSQLLVITDGITEALTTRGEPLGSDRFEQILHLEESIGDARPSLWLSHLLDRVGRCTGRCFEDDWTAFVLRATEGHDGNDVKPDRPNAAAGTES